MVHRPGLLLAALMLAPAPALAEGGNGGDREPAGGAFNSSYSRNVSSDSRPLSVSAVRNGGSAATGSGPEATGSLQRRRTIERR